MPWTVRAAEAPTEAGERLLRVVAPRFEEIESELASLRELRQKPAGTIRITATEFAIDTILLPKLTPVMRENPDIKIEFTVDYGLSNIVAERYDAGLRRRRDLPALLRAQIMLRQNGRCFDCGTRLMLGRIVFDHRPPLALRKQGDDANDPDRLAAICRTCEKQKTPRDLQQIAKTNRLALDHQDFVERMRDKIPGRPVPSKGQWQKVKQEMNKGK